MKKNNVLWGLLVLVVAIGSCGHQLVAMQADRAESQHSYKEYSSEEALKMGEKFYAENKVNFFVGWMFKLGLFSQENGTVFRYVKYGPDRVSESLKIQKIIDEKNLDKVGVPKKQLVHVKGPEDLQYDPAWDVYASKKGLYLAVCQCINGHTLQELQRRRQGLSLEEVKQMTTIIEEAGYSDMHPHNFVREENTNKIFFIDTEGTKKSWNAYTRSFNYSQMCDALGKFRGRFLMEDEARKYLHEKYSECISGLKKE
jgi:hypothetical protein